MKIADLIVILASRARYLAAQRETFARLGDLEQVQSLDREIAETQNTLDLLNTLPS